MSGFLKVLSLVIAMLLCGAFNVPRADAFGGARARAQARGDARVARALGGPVVVHGVRTRVFVAPGFHGGGVQSLGFGQTIIIR